MQQKHDVQLLQLLRTLWRCSLQQFQWQTITDLAPSSSILLFIHWRIPYRPSLGVAQPVVQEDFFITNCPSSHKHKSFQNWSAQRTCTSTPPFEPKATKSPHIYFCRISKWHIWNIGSHLLFGQRKVIWANHDIRDHTLCRMVGKMSQGQWVSPLQHLTVTTPSLTIHRLTQQFPEPIWTFFSTFYVWHYFRKC